MDGDVDVVIVVAATHVGVIVVVVAAAVVVYPNDLICSRPQLARPAVGQAHRLC
jgi:hypothetical protein